MYSQINTSNKQDKSSSKEVATRHVWYAETRTRVMEKKHQSKMENYFDYVSFVRILV